MVMRVEGKDLNVEDLLEREPTLEDLQIYTIKKADIKNLNGLEKLPLKSLELRWFTGPDLMDVMLPPTLETLKVWHCGKIKSLEGIQSAPDLNSLIFDDNCNLENTEPLQALQKLKELQLSGGRGTTHKVSSINSIADLPIERLTMFSIDGRGLDLTPITQLRNLRELDLAGPCFEPKELAKVAAAYPWFLEQLLDLPYTELSGFGCKKCNGKQKEMFLKGKKGLWCPSCNQDGIDKTLNDFKTLVEQS